MGDEYFTSGHLALLAEFNPQLVESNQRGRIFLVPDENFPEVARRLNLFSCKSMIRGRAGEINHDNYSASRLCKLCSPEKGLNVVNVTDTSGDSVYFYGFPRELFRVKTILGLKGRDKGEILDLYLRNFHERLRTKCVEGLEKAGEVKWERSSYRGEQIEGQIEPEIRNLHSFLEDLDKLVKETPEEENTWSKEYNFELCSNHVELEPLKRLEQEFRENRIKEFLERHNIQLKKEDIKVRFLDEKIFTLENQVQVIES